MPLGPGAILQASPFDSPFHSRGAFHYAKDSGNFGRNLNGKVRLAFFSPEYSGSPLEVVHIFWSEYSDQNSPFHFWLTRSLPLLGNSVTKFKMTSAFSIGWPDSMAKCLSIFLRFLRPVSLAQWKAPNVVLGSLRTQTYFRLSLATTDYIRRNQWQPERRLRYTPLSQTWWNPTWWVILPPPPGGILTSLAPGGFLKTPWWILVLPGVEF